MKSLSIVLVVALAAAPLASVGRGFDMSNDTRSASGSNGAGAYNKNTGNAATYNKNTGTATTYNKNTDTTTTYDKNTSSSTTSDKTSGSYNGTNSAAAYNKNTGTATTYNKNTGTATTYNKNTDTATTYNKNTDTATVYNKNTGTTSTYHYNTSGTNAYYYTGHVVVNPVYVGPAWGWNHGFVWAPVGAYWGGGFWGAFAVGAATAAVMGYVVSQNQRYTSYAVSTGSPGATLLSSYGLQQVPCGPPGLVVLYGPNFAIICANPNSRVAAGNYAVNVNTLTIQSQ